MQLTESMHGELVQLTESMHGELVRLVIAHWKLSMGNWCSSLRAWGTGATGYSSLESMGNWCQLIESSPIISMSGDPLTEAYNIIILIGL